LGCRECDTDGLNRRGGDVATEQEPRDNERDRIHANNAQQEREKERPLLEQGAPGRPGGPSEERCRQSVVEDQLVDPRHLVAVEALCAPGNVPKKQRKK
jgi:hypothetical protein